MAVYPGDTVSFWNNQQVRRSVGTVSSVYAAQAKVLSGGQTYTVPVTQLADYTTGTAGPLIGLPQVAPQIKELYGAAENFNVLELLQPSGDTTGATDTLNIQNLLNSGIALLALGTFYINADLIFKPGAVLQGSGGWDPLVWGDVGTVLKCVSGYAGTAVLNCPDVSHTITQGPILANFAIDGSALVATIDGLRATGPVNAGVMQNVFISGVTGVGWNGVTDSSASGQTYPYGWHLYHIKINTTGEQGVVCSNHTDATWIDVHTINTTGNGWSFAGPCPNSRFIGVKAEWTGIGKDGFHLTGSWSSGTGSGGMTFVGASTDRCDNNGMSITATGNVPVLLDGCMFRRDGRNNGSGGGNFAGLNINGATIPVSVAGLSVFPGVDDNGAGTTSPEYGLSVTNAGYVSIEAGYIQGNAAGFNNGGGSTSLQIGGSVVFAAGTTSSVTPTRYKAAPFTSKPTAPSATASLTLVMMGLGTTATGTAWAYTPAGSGNVLVICTGNALTNTGAANVTIGPRYGTGVAPTNGTAVTGTRFGTAGDPIMRPSSNGVGTGFSFTDVLALTPGTTYWFDLSLETGNGSDTAQLQDVAITLVEQ